MDEQVERIRHITEIQGRSGNWDYDPYGLGMYNALEMCLAILEDREPMLREAPAEWLEDKER